MSFFISNAYAQGGPQPSGSPMVSLIFMLGLFIFFWFIIIRPQRKRQKEHEQLVNNVSKGDEVVMTSGLLGKVIKIDGDYLVVQAADGVELKFQKVAVHAVLPKGTLKAI
ncbi:MAG: preprotein translocase subunit YajC [Pseudomonadales bacterium]|nr:preprotein translocase subunit YajC [Pseudomonadales bacterium]MDG2078180.1 preprotein translocase subunit YajC [Pseudomonadales bacterium]